MVKTPYETGGFAFSDRQAMAKARREEEGIAYIKSSADMNDPKMLYEVYCQMIGRQLFETPAGYAILHEIQKELKKNPVTKDREIPAIPVIGMRGGDSAGKKAQGPPQAAPRTGAKNVDYRLRFRASATVGVILLLIVVGMFAVAATGDHVNIVNYENKLIEKYENWEAQLKEREALLKERENALLQGQAGDDGAID